MMEAMTPVKTETRQDVPCIVCSSKLVDSRSTDDNDNNERVTRKRKSPSSILGGGSGRSGSSVVEELCHQLKITDEELLESISRRNWNVSWTLCSGCGPLIERAVNKRRQCLVVEDRVSQLQSQLLRELKKLKEEMDHFYLNLKEIERLAKVEDHGSNRNEAAVDEGRGGGDHLGSFKKAIFKVVNDLQLYQNEVAVKLLTTFQRDTSHDGGALLVKVKEEPHLDVGSGLEHEYDPEWMTADNSGESNHNISPTDGGTGNMKSKPVHSRGKRKSYQESDDAKWSSDDDSAISEDSSSDEDDDAQFKKAAKTAIKLKHQRKQHKLPAPRRGLRTSRKISRLNHSGGEDRIDQSSAKTTSATLNSKRRKRRPATEKKKFDQEVPRLTQEERLRFDNDPDLAQIPPLRRYFLLRSQQKDQEGRSSNSKRQIVPINTPKATDMDLLRKKYSLEYNTRTGTVSLNKLEVILNEEAELIRCSSCPFTVTLSEMQQSFRQPNRHFAVVMSKVEQKMADHILGFHQNRFNCPFCDVKNTVWAKYFCHVKYTHLDQFTCEICNRPGMNRTKLLIHKWSHLNKEERQLQEPPCKKLMKPDPGDRVTCDICGKQYANKPALRNHKRSHLPGGDRVICPICGKALRKYFYESHHKKFVCPVPDPDLEANNDREWDPQSQVRVQCTHCPMTLKNKYSLKQHIARMHTTPLEERQVLCPFCGKDFPRRFNLQLHMKRMHAEGKKTWQCGWGCGEEFEDKRSCTVHEGVCPKKPEVYSEATSSSQTVRGEKEPHPCLHCTAILKNRQVFRQHMKRFHSPEAEARPHVCPICGKGFRMRGDLTDHVKKHREEKQYNCPWGCGKSFKMKNYCTNHEAVCKARPEGYNGRGKIKI